MFSEECNTDEPIQKFYVDGFRSLLKFEISINRGLNVICGPNGSGKTNFIEFLDFFGDFINIGAAHAISRSGGLARVFSIENVRKQKPSIVIKSHGIADINSRRSAAREIYQKSYFKYEYEVEIKFNKITSETFISSEKIRLYKRSENVSGAIESSSLGSICRNIKGSGVELSQSIDVGPRLKVNSVYNPFEARTRIRQQRPVDEWLDSFAVAELEPDRSLVGLRSIVPFEAMRRSLSRGQSVNILPEKAKRLNDITDVPGLRRDGTGLSSTLFYLQSASEGRNSERYGPHSIYSSEGFETITQWTKVIFPELENIIVTRDMISGKFNVYLNVGSQKQLRIPLQSLSDGTIKWLATLSLILTSSGPSSLEEPENFLHPKVQSYLVDIIRENVSDASDLRYFILSSHSETIINSCFPEELIIFKFDGNKTVADRIVDPKTVRDEINKTGFGLGYYYARGAIS